MVNLNEMFGLPTAGDIAEMKREGDFADGYAAASVMVLTIDKALRDAYPGMSEAFYNGIIAGMREEL